MLDLNLKVEAIIKAIGVLPIKSALLMADVVIGVLLFVPERVLQFLYISEIVRMHRQCLGLSFFVVSACLAVMCIHSVVQWIRIRKMYTGSISVVPDPLETTGFRACVFSILKTHWVLLVLPVLVAILVIIFKAKISIVSPAESVRLLEQNLAQ